MEKKVAEGREIFLGRSIYQLIFPFSWINSEKLFLVQYFTNMFYWPFPSYIKYTQAHKYLGVIMLTRRNTEL